jgi:transposase
LLVVISLRNSWEQERERRHTQRVIRHKKIWELFRAGYSKGDIARIVGVSLQSIYRALEQEQPPSRRHWRSTHHVVDPYVSYLTKRWNEGCHVALQLYQEVVAQGYTGSVRTIRRTVAQLRPHGSASVTKQMITWQTTPSPRNVALMIVRPAEKRTQDQTRFIDQLCKSDPTAATAYNLAQAFGSLLRNLEGKPGWEKWKAAVGVSGIPELIDFMEGLANDIEAVVNGCTEPWNNGMVEGFVNKVKWIKRSSYGQAGFPLLQRRVLLHPRSRGTVSQRGKRSA